SGQLFEPFYLVPSYRPLPLRRHRICSDCEMGGFNLCDSVEAAPFAREAYHPLEILIPLGINAPHDLPPRLADLNARLAVKRTREVAAKPESGVAEHLVRCDVGRDLQSLIVFLLEDLMRRDLSRLIHGVDVRRPPFVKLIATAPREPQKLTDGHVIRGVTITRFAEQFSVFHVSRQHTVDGAVRVAWMCRKVLVAEPIVVLRAHDREPHQAVSLDLFHHLVIVPRGNMDSSTPPEPLPHH